jgi:hypothetical protein
MFLGICEIYHPKIHGGENTYMKYKYFVRQEFELEEFYNNDFEDYIELMKDFYYDNVIDNNNMDNKDYRHYNSIVSNNRYYTINIIKEVDSYEQMTGVIKTHYISLLQRKWKRIYKERIRVINLRKSLKSLLYRELHGKWPQNCARYL